MQEATEDVPSVGTFFDVQLDQEDSWNIARVEMSPKCTLQLILMQNPKKAEQPLELDGKGYRKAPFRSNTAGIPAAIRTGLVRLPTSIASVQNIIGALLAYKQGELLCGQVLQLLRGRHPFTMETLLSNEYPSSQIRQTFKEYLSATFKFMASYFSSLKFQEYYELAFSVEERTRSVDPFAIRFGNPYRSSTAAHQSSYLELLESFRSAINGRDGIKLYLCNGKAPNSERVNDLKRVLLPFLTDSFLPEVTANLKRLTENPYSLCPLRVIFSLLTLADVIYQRHLVPGLLQPVAAFVNALLRLQLKTMDQLEKLPAERLRFYLEEKMVPEAFSKYLGDETKILIVEVEIRYFPIFTKLGREGLQRFAERLGKISNRTDYQSKFSTLLENSILFDFILSFKDSADSQLLLRIVQELAKVCSSSSTLLDKTILTLLESNNPFSGQALAQLLIKAPKEVRERNLAELEIGKADEQESCKFLRMIIRLAETFSDTENLRRLGKIGLRYLRQCEESVAADLFLVLEKNSEISLEMMTECIEQLGTDRENEPSYILMVKLFDLKKQCLPQPYLEYFKKKVFATIDYNMQTHMEKLRRRLILLFKINMRASLNEEEMLHLIDIFQKATIEITRSIIISRFFLRDEDSGHPSPLLHDEARKKLIAVLEIIGLKDIKKFELYISLMISVHTHSGVLSFNESGQLGSLEFLVDAFLKINDSDLIRRVAQKISKIYSMFEEKEMERSCRKLFEKVLSAEDESGYYLLGLINDIFSSEAATGNKTPTKIPPVVNQVSSDRKTVLAHAQAGYNNNPTVFNTIQNATVNAHQQASTESSSIDTLPSDIRHKIFDQLVQEYFMRAFDQLPKSWELVNRRECQSTPIADLLIRASNNQQWSKLFNGCFNRRFYLLRAIDTLRISIEWLESTQALEVFAVYIQKEMIYADKYIYNCLLFDMLEQSYGGPIEKGTNSELLKNITEVLISVFYIPSEWLRMIDSGIVCRTIHAAFKLMTKVEPDSVTSLLKENMFVKLVSAACNIDNNCITELVVHELQRLIDNSENWKDALNALLSQQLGVDQWRAERELLIFVSLFLKASETLRLNLDYIEVLFKLSLQMIQDRTMMEHRLEGYLCILRSLFNQFEDLVMQLPEEFVTLLTHFFFHRDRNIVSLAYELFAMVCIRPDFREKITNLLIHYFQDKLYYCMDTKEEIGHIPRRNYFVGLQNPRCICYMNSFLQQLFSIRQFGEALLRTDWELKSNPSQDLILQMKHCWMALQNSDLESHNNDRFYDRAYRNIDGSPVNISYQMDADQFGKNLFDQMEKQLPKDNNLVSKFFQGQLETTVASEQCEHRSSRCEDFISLQLNIQGLTFSKALQELTKPEILQNDNAYSCDQCNRKVRASKSAKLKRLPNVLIFVLKRFEYNRELNMRQKLNSQFDFPMESFAITKQLCETEQPTYRLRGTVVHSGTSEAGHYFSFIRQHDTWFLFDDSHVERTDSDKVKRRSFGSDRTYESAYLLFYDKVSTNYGDLIEVKPYLYPCHEYLDSVHQTILAENRKQVAFSKDMSDFVDVCLKREYKECFDVKCLLWLYFFNVRIYTIESPEPLFSFLKEANLDPAMVDSSINWNFIEAIISLQVDNCVELKHYCCNLLTGYIRQLGLPGQYKTVNFFILLSYKSSNSNYIYLLLIMMAHNNRPLVEYMIQKKMVGRIMDVFMSSTGLTTHQNTFEKNMRNLEDVDALEHIDVVPQQIYDRETPRYRWVLLEILLTHSESIPLQEKERLREHSRRYLKKVFEEANNKISLNRICSYLRLMSSDTAFSDSLTSNLDKELKQARVDNLRPCLRILLMLCGIEDAHAETRIRSALRTFLDLMNEGLSRVSWNINRETEVTEEYRNEPRVLFEVVVQWLMRVLRNIPRAATIFRTQAQFFRFLESFLYRPYNSSKIYQRNVTSFLAQGQLNDMTRNILHGIILPDTQRKHEQLYRDIREFFQKMLAPGIPQVFEIDYEMDGDLFLQELDSRRKVRYLRQVHHHCIQTVSCEIRKVFGETIYLATDKQDKEHTYQEFVCYLPQDASTGDHSPHSTEPVSDTGGQSP